MVGLVEHGDLDRRRAGRAALDQVDQPARGGDDDVDARDAGRRSGGPSTTPPTTVVTRRPSACAKRGRGRRRPGGRARGSAPAPGPGARVAARGRSRPSGQPGAAPAGRRPASCPSRSGRGRGRRGRPARRAGRGVWIANGALDPAPAQGRDQRGGQAELGERAVSRGGSLRCLRQGLVEFGMRCPGPVTPAVPLRALLARALLARALLAWALLARALLARGGLPTSRLTASGRGRHGHLGHLGTYGSTPSVGRGPRRVRGATTTAYRPGRSGLVTETESSSQRATSRAARPREGRHDQWRHGRQVSRHSHRSAPGACRWPLGRTSSPPDRPLPAVPHGQPVAYGGRRPAARPALALRSADDRCPAASHRHRTPPAPHPPAGRASSSAGSWSPRSPARARARCTPARPRPSPPGSGTTLPVYVERAGGGILVDVDGNQLIDFGSGHRRHQRRATPPPRWSPGCRPRSRPFTHTCFMVTPYEGYVEVCEALNRLTPGDARQALGAVQLRGRGGGERRQDRPPVHRPRRRRRLRPRLPRPHQPDDGDDRQEHALQGRLRPVRRRGLPRADVLPVPRARPDQRRARPPRGRSR